MARRAKKQPKLAPKTKRAVKAIVKRAIRADQEIKHFNVIPDQSYAPLAVTNTMSGPGAVLTCLTNVTQGVGDSDRIGDTLTPIRLNFRYTLNYGDTYNNVRVILFRWKPAAAISGAFPNGNQILNVAGMTVAENFPLAPYNRDLVDQYTILYDRTHTLNSVNSINAISKKVSLKLSKKEIRFTAATSDHSRGIWLFAISDSAGVPNPGLIFTSELLYTDS